MPNNEFQVLIQAIVDAKDVQARLNAIKDLSVKIEKLNLDQSAIDSLRNQLSKNGVDINLVLGNVNQVQTQAAKVGQQIGKLITENAEKAINNVSSPSIGKYFKIDQSTSNQFRNEINKLVSEWTNAKGSLTDIKIDTRTSYDTDLNENITRLHQATVSYKNELDEVIKKTIAWRRIGTTTDAKGNEKAVRGFVEVAGQYSKSLDNTNKKTDTFIEKQKKAVAQLQNSLSSIQSSYLDKNVSKPIKSEKNIDSLDNQYRYTEQAITNLGSANKNTFTDMQIEAQKQISILKDMIKEYRNAENVSVKLKGTDVSTGISVAKNDLEKFKADAKDFPQINKTIQELDTSLSNVGDASSLNKFTDQLRVARSELAKIKSETSSSNRDEKIGINISGLISKISDIQRISPQINDFKTQINGAEVSVKSLLDDLKKVSTQGDFSIIDRKFKAFSDSAKAAGIVISEVVTQNSRLEKIQLSIGDGTYSTQIDKLQSQFQRYGLSVSEAENKVKELRSTLSTMEVASGEKLVSEFGKWQTQVKGVKVQLDQAKLSYDKFAQPVSDEKVSSLIVKIQDFLSRNTAITKEARAQLERYVTELNGKNISEKRWKDINIELERTKINLRGLGKLGRSLKDQFAQAASSFAQWISVSSLIMTGVYKTKEAISELKELDNVLTEISKTSDLTKTKLQELGATSFAKASDFGRSAADYLTAVMEMSRSGYYGEQGEAMAKVSLLAQAAGDMTAELANKYVLATNAAYKYNGEAEKLNAVLDGENSITNQNSVAMSDMATAMSEAGTVAASYRISIEDLSAMIGTIESVTKLGGSEVGTGIKSLLINLQNISSSKIVGTLDDANASMTEMVNGVEQLRDPISILRDLAKTFNELDEADPMRAKILTNIGGKAYHAA